MKHATIVGSGPNGLSAAIALARAGVHVTVLEAAGTLGGSARTEALTLPGYLHDAGAAVFPLGVASPFFRTLPLAQHGLAWIEPEVPLAHPLDGRDDDGDAVGQLHDLRATADLLGEDGPAWMELVQPLMAAWPEVLSDLLGPLFRLPAHPMRVARFGLRALQSAEHIARSSLRTPRARALFAGLAGHANVPLSFAASAAPALVLAASAHTTGWPIVRGGAGALTAALASYLRELGGEVVIDQRVTKLRDLPMSDVTLLDLGPQQLVDFADDGSLRERSTLQNFRRSPGVCKVDWALSAPIPWTAELCRRAGTIHLGGSLEEIARSEQDAWDGMPGRSPYVLLAQPSLFDPTRAPAGHHTAWAYCHVPLASGEDFTGRIEAQVERFAPGFGACILARHTRVATEMERWNPTLAGGDISGGAMTLAQILRRPTLPPYRTSLPGVFLCSSSTPPGGGVHGMCGYLAAVAAARHMGIRLPALHA